MAVEGTISTEGKVATGEITGGWDTIGSYIAQGTNEQSVNTDHIHTGKSVSDEVLLKMQVLEEQQRELRKFRDQQENDRIAGQNLSVGDVVRDNTGSYGDSMGVITMIQDASNVNIDWCAAETGYYPPGYMSTHTLEKAPLQDFVLALQRKADPANTPYNKGDPVYSPSYYPNWYGVISQDQSANETYVFVDWKVCAEIPPGVETIDDASLLSFANYPPRHIADYQLVRVPLSEYLHALHEFKERQEEDKQKQEEFKREQEKNQARLEQTTREQQQQDTLDRLAREKEVLQEEVERQKEQNAKMNMTFEQVLQRLEELERREQTQEVKQEIEALEQQEVMPVLYGMSKMQIAIKLAAAVGKGIGKGVIFRMAQTLGNQFGINVESLVKFFLG